MRQFTLAVSLIALFASFAEPAQAGKEGVPGRRTGGGTRLTQSRIKVAKKPVTRFQALTFASRTNLPTSLKIKALYG